MRAMKTKPYFFSTGNSPYGNFMWTYTPTSFSRITSTPDYNSLANDFYSDIQFDTSETQLFVMSNYPVYKINVTNPAAPANFTTVFQWPNSQIWNPEEMVIARDESFMMILGESSMVGVFSMNSTSTTFSGWFYANGKTKNKVRI